MASPESEKSAEELFREYRETKASEIRDELVARHLKLAELLASKYAGRGAEYEDIFQAASYALVLAVERYDPNKGVKFGSFATPTIIGEIKKFFRDTMWSLKVPRRMKEIAVKIIEAKKALQDQNGHVPTVKELAEYLNISEENIIEALESSQAYTTFSLDNKQEGMTEKEALPYENHLGENEQGYEWLEVSGILDSVLNMLSPRERVIAHKRFVQEISQKEVAEELGLSQVAISRIERKMKDKFLMEYSRQDRA